MNIINSKPKQPKEEESAVNSSSTVFEKLITEKTSNRELLVTQKHKPSSCSSTTAQVIAICIVVNVFFTVTLGSVALKAQETFGKGQHNNKKDISWLTAVIDPRSALACDCEGAQPPCLLEGQRLVSLAGSKIGPLTCEKHLPQGTRSECSAKKGLRFSEDKHSIEVLEDGVYLVYMHLTFYDHLNHHVTAGITINDNMKHWKTCVAHTSQTDFTVNMDALHSLRAPKLCELQRHKKPNKIFTFCSIFGMGFFKSGDSISMTVSDSFRYLSVNDKITYLNVIQLS